MIKKGVNSKKGQLTLFIIIALVILGAMMFFLYPRIKILFVPKTAVSIVDECISESLNEALELVSKQGGSIEPTLFMAYQGNNVEYLCYTNDNFKTCVMQQPLLKQHIEREIKDYIEPRAMACIDNLKEEMTARGYAVTSEYKGTSVEIVPNRVNVNIVANVILKKEGTETFNRFSTKRASKMYDLVMLSTSILNFEAHYGDAETTTYMIYYPTIMVEKLKQGDGSKIYNLIDVNTQEKFTFATRSLVFPGGYKLSG